MDLNEEKEGASLMYLGKSSKFVVWHRKHQASSVVQFNSQMFCIARCVYLDEITNGLCSPHNGISYVRLVPISDGANQTN